MPGKGTGIVRVCIKLLFQFRKPGEEQEFPEILAGASCEQKNRGGIHHLQKKCGYKKIKFQNVPAMYPHLLPDTGEQ